MLSTLATEKSTEAHNDNSPNKQALSNVEIHLNLSGFDASNLFNINFNILLYYMYSIILYDKYRNKKTEKKIAHMILSLLQILVVLSGKKSNGRYDFH